jgi:DtxR family Mn-dependent transcriptional regulator
MKALLSLIVLALLGWVLWPGRGLLARWRAGRCLLERSRREDALKHILKQEANGLVPTLEGVAGALQLKRDQAVAMLEDMEQHGLISFEQGRLRLEAAGRELAVHIVRAHRLWESYLAEQTGVAESRWHGLAERQEHLLSQQQAKSLSAQLGHPTHDPHGDSIPEEHGELKADTGQPLNAVLLNAPMLIAHVEDEPEAIYAQLTALGLRAGMKVVVIEKSPQRIRFWADGVEHVLAPILANNVACVPLADVTSKDLFAEEYLSGLLRGEKARVLGLTPACRGAERRRLLDLGFVPGSIVEIEMISPAGDPTAYRVRGTLIALRREQAGLIRIVKQEALAA